MTKPKTKLVCVGWGIWDFRYKCIWTNRYGRSRFLTRKIAIGVYDDWHEKGYYRFNQRRGIIIAKKLWVEVKG